jgi:hypothetical protein
MEKLQVASSGLTWRLERLDALLWFLGHLEAEAGVRQHGASAALTYTMANGYKLIHLYVKIEVY